MQYYLSKLQHLFLFIAQLEFYLCFDHNKFPASAMYKMNLIYYTLITVAPDHTRHM